jgi:hypothetical protein
MPSNLPLITIGLMALQPAGDPGLLIATDHDLSTSVQLVETDQEIRFEFTGPEHVLPSIAVDVNRNGVVDKNLDFQIGLGTGGAICFQYLLREGASTTCKPPGEKAKLAWKRNGDGTATTISLQKREISGDGFGFGFAISLWNVTGSYGTTLVGGDYRFGGKLSLVSDGPNFTGRRKPDIPLPMLPALRRYQGCVNRAIDALAPLDRSMAAKVRALPNACAGERSAALDEGVSALVAAGTQLDEATEMMRSSLDQYDEGIGQMAEQLEKGG